MLSMQSSLVASDQKVMIKIFNVICSAFCILSMLELSFCMERFVDSEETINRRTEDKTSFELNAHDANMFVIDMYNAFADLTNLERVNKGINIFPTKLVNIEPSDRSIKDFMVIKIPTSKSLPYLEELDKTFESHKDKIFGNPSITVSINSRPSKYIIYRNMLDAIDFTHGIIYTYANLARYSFREAVECLNNAQSKMSDECIKSGKVSHCFVTSSACGMYYGFNDEKKN